LQVRISGDSQQTMWASWQNHTAPYQNHTSLNLFQPSEHVSRMTRRDPSREIINVFGIEYRIRPESPYFFENFDIKYGQRFRLPAMGMVRLIT
jgi:hypothetical protein